jgi:hypothetical protein
MAEVIMEKDFSAATASEVPAAKELAKVCVL